MDQPPTRFDIWHEIVDDAAVWERFDQRFAFTPDYDERAQPAIRLAPGCLVVDLAPIFNRPPAGFAADQAHLNAAAFEAFAHLIGDGDVIAIDWQHPTYRYSPQLHAGSGAEPAIEVFPDGDYYAHMRPDLSWGTFGHPWQQTLTLWGDELTSTLGAELLTWLPRHPQSPI